MIFWLLSLILFRKPIIGLANLSIHDELASHVLLIPLISGLLIYWERNRIFPLARYSPAFGLPLLLLVLILWFGLRDTLSAIKQERLSVEAALIVLTWIAGFVLFYGVSSFRAAVFPVLFLFLMVPLPIVVSQHLISILQKGSAVTCFALFRLIGVPVIRHGFRFALPGVEIEVAEQCSGIHSGSVPIIAGLLAEYILLRGPGKRPSSPFAYSRSRSSRMQSGS